MGFGALHGHPAMPRRKVWSPYPCRHLHRNLDSDYPDATNAIAQSGKRTLSRCRCTHSRVWPTGLPSIRRSRPWAPAGSAVNAAQTLLRPAQEERYSSMRPTAGDSLSHRSPPWGRRSTKAKRGRGYATLDLSEHCHADVRCYLKRKKTGRTVRTAESQSLRLRSDVSPVQACEHPGADDLPVQLALCQLAIVPSRSVPSRHRHAIMRGVTGRTRENEASLAPVATRIAGDGYSSHWNCGCCLPEGRIATGWRGRCKGDKPSQRLPTIPCFRCKDSRR